jgi:hypothetical protein
VPRPPFTAPATVHAAAVHTRGGSRTRPGPKCALAAVLLTLVHAPVACHHPRQVNVCSQCTHIIILPG